MTICLFLFEREKIQSGHEPDAALWYMACLSPTLQMNKSIWFLLRDSKTKQRDTQGHTGKLVLSADSQATGSGSKVTAFAVPAIETSPLTSCPMCVGFSVGEEHVALPATPLEVIAASDPVWRSWAIAGPGWALLMRV